MFVLQEDAVTLVQNRTSVVMAILTGERKTLPMIVASLETSHLGLLILPLVSLEQQMEQDLEHLGIPYVNLTSSTTKGLEEKLMDPDLEIVLTNFEALAGKE